MAPHADADSKTSPHLNTPSCPFRIARGPYPNGYGPLSAMTYLSNKDYLR